MSNRAGRAAVNVTYLRLVLGFLAMFVVSFLGPFPSEGILEGSEVFCFTFMIECLTLPSPGLSAAISRAVATFADVGISLVTIPRVRSEGTPSSWLACSCQHSAARSLHPESRAVSRCRWPSGSCCYGSANGCRCRPAPVVVQSQRRLCRRRRLLECRIE